MCDHHAFNPSAVGNMNEPFFQHDHDCGHTHHDRSPSPNRWMMPEQWLLAAQIQESQSTTPISTPSLTKDMDCFQYNTPATEADHNLALALCVDECGECSDPTCSEPDCEADIIECNNASCAPSVSIPATCHGGTNTLCVGNLPPDVLDGAAVLAALRPPSYTPMYPPQNPHQYVVPLCVAIAAGYYNPGHIHSHLPQCGPHSFSNDFYDTSYNTNGGSMMPQSYDAMNGFAFDHNQDCQYTGMYYDMGANTVAHMPFDQNIMKQAPPLSPMSTGPQHSFAFSQDSTPSSASTFPSPLQQTSEIPQTQRHRAPSNASTISAAPTCRWEVEKGVICGHICETSAQLQSHIQQAHTAPLRKANGFTCEWQGCPRREKGGDSFAQRSKLDRHIQSHTGYKASVCSICGQQFSTTQSLILHQRTHSGEKPHKCPVPGCGYAAAQASQLTMHNRTKHTKEKPLKCDFPGCNARFAESSNLSKHKKIHLPEAQCTCPLCFKSFSRDDQLKRHLKTHARKASEERGRSASVTAGAGGAKSQPTAAQMGMVPLPMYGGAEGGLKMEGLVAAAQS